MITDRPVLLVVSGPTAVGKTSLAITLAQLFSAEIISADSRQFYREMSIGTACPSQEQLSAIPHHFIQHLSVNDAYNIGKYEQDVLSKLDELFSKSRFAVLVGGSGLYIRAVCQGVDLMPDYDETLRTELKMLYSQGGINVLQKKLKDLDPEYYHRVDQWNPVRLIRALEVCISSGTSYSSLRKNKPAARKFNTISIGLTMPREELYHRISLRTDEMLGSGLIEEARALYPVRHLNALNAVGYRELFNFFDGIVSLSSATELIKQNTRHYAKRQMTWFRKDPQIRWFNPEEWKDIPDFIQTKIAEIS